WLLSQILLWTLAPSPKSTKASASGTESPFFIDRVDFFDYPDSDHASILAVARFIGERPVVFVNSGSSPGLFHHILVGALVVAFLFLLFQFCTHMSFQKGA
uniref:Chromosome 16 open reading frame 92 n=1 Tax=Sciurus vulgaris TaxID=55149 RepID=A0A8D2DRJ3_SCIVU